MSDKIVGEIEVPTSKKKVAKKKVAKQKAQEPQEAAVSPPPSALAAFASQDDVRPYEEARERIGDCIWWTKPDGEEVELAPFSAMVQLWFAKLRDLLNLGDTGTMYLALWLLTHDYKEVSKLYRALRIKKEYDLETDTVVETVLRGEILEIIEEWINDTFVSVSDDSLDEVGRVFTEIIMRQAAAQTVEVDPSDAEESEPGKR